MRVSGQRIMVGALGVLLASGVAVTMVVATSPPSARQTSEQGPVLPRDTVVELFTPARVASIDGFDHLYVACGINEGWRCGSYVADGQGGSTVANYGAAMSGANLVDDDASAELIEALDPRSIERARDNTVLIHCLRGGDAIICAVAGQPGRWRVVDLV